MNRAKKIATAICVMFAVGAGLIFGRPAILADEFPPPDTELNDLPGDLPMGRYIEYIATDVSTNSVSLSNGVLVVGSEALDLFEMTNLTYEAAVRDAAEGTKEAIGSLSNEMAKVSFSGDYSDLTNKPSLNGVSLSGNKTGADLGVLDLSGGTMTGEFRVGADYNGNFQVVPETDYTPPTMRFGDGAGVVGIIWSMGYGYVVMDVSDISGSTYRIAWPSASGTLALSSDIDAAISSTSPAFSNAVLSVGLGIDTNTVAAINELVDSSHGLPVLGMTSVGALLLALAAAIAALKRGKADKSDVDPLLFAQYYPEGNVKSAAEFTSGIKYDAPDTTNRTITVKPFCNTGTAENDNSSIAGRVVIPPFVDASGNPYISDDGTRFKVVGVSVGGSINNNTNLTAIIAPNTVRTIGVNAFNYCTTLTSVSLPAATTIGDGAFYYCPSLTSISLPAATTIGERAFRYCTLLTFADFGDTPRSSVPALGSNAFSGVSTSCKIIVPYTQYDAWTAASGWSTLTQEFVRHAEKADKPATFTAGNLAKFDSNGNPVDAGCTAGDLARYSLTTKTISNNAVTLDDRANNYVDARALGSSNSLDIDFPALVDGKARDFVLAVECGANPPAISYAAFVTIMAEDASTLTPEEGMNIYSFTEFKTNMFLASRKTVDTVVVNTPENVDQLLLAMQKRGIDTTGITDFGGVESALGLSDTATPQDAIDAVMN